MTDRDELQRSIESLNAHEWVFNRTLLLSKFGGTHETRQFLRWCATCIENGAALPTPFAADLAKRLNEIAELDDPWSAKLLKRARGRATGNNYHFENHIATAVWTLCHRKYKNKKVTVREAAEVVAARSEIEAAQARRLKKELPTHPMANPNLYRRVSADYAEKLYYKHRAILDGKELTSTFAAVRAASTIKLETTGCAAPRTSARSGKSKNNRQ